MAVPWPISFCKLRVFCCLGFPRGSKIIPISPTRIIHALSPLDITARLALPQPAPILLISPVIGSIEIYDLFFCTIPMVLFSPIAIYIYIYII